jgi:hypothetical protein
MTRTAIVVTFDRLPCAGLACYGNEWIDTPGFDALAADGLVFENHIATEVRGDTALIRSPRLDADWIAALREQGIRTALLHEPHSGLVVNPAAFDTVLDCGGSDGVDVSPTELPFAKLSQRATAWLAESASADRLLWLASAGLPDICRPPAEALDLYVEEFADRDIDWEALSPEEFGRQPAIRAAYLSLLDHWLGELRAGLERIADPVLLIVLGCEGLIWQPVPRRSSVPGGLESQRTNPPWLVWSNTLAFLPGRCHDLVQITDLPTMVQDWWNSSPLAPVGGGEGTRHTFPEPATRNPQPAIITRGPDGAVGVRTLTEAVVFSRLPADGAAPEPADVRCFLKPEDVWDVNDVADTRPDPVTRAMGYLQEARG